ncbi:LacI family DNA-binding transcriptional regulator [Ideonella azotifigens]|uniref:LacI family DNA-binding transcriptional regulator n=1 Tax=Ideonella azotifigens TaxID=513160 RepID=A0ABP3VLI7_9BURK|nr:LacI family DNA-binding transcriptional regulator [Ideonella azotifigens]MCD2343757.1 LacI family DNA-binding transcriptional regulator [Ideonella azotifigens]
MTRTPTIADVARLAGVGKGTASRAISGNGAVSPETLARVREAVAALNFRPSNAARALSTKRTGMVGIYVHDFAGDFFGPILQAVDGELRGANRHMVAANGCGLGVGAGPDDGDARQRALDGIRFLIERECDGVLVVSNALSSEDLDMLWSEKAPLVVLNQTSPSKPEHCFSTDHELAGRLAAHALLQQGHRELACISGLHTAPDNALRMAGFHAELAQHGVIIPPSHQREGQFSFDGGHAAAQALLAQGLDFSALFCANDTMAMAAIACLGKAGVKVPDQLSVLGFDDSVLARYTTPALSTVRVPSVDMAANGCRFLLNLCYGLTLPVQREFPPEVVWRDSVRPGPHANESTPAVQVKMARKRSPTFKA